MVFTLWEKRGEYVAVNTNKDIVRHGIVLRFYAPYRYKVSLLDAELGRVDAVFAKPAVFRSLVHGGLISYRLEWHRTLYRMSDVELIATPASWAATDILFVHHVLEMSLAFLQEHNRCPAVVQLFKQLYEDIPHDLDQILFKRFFLGKFFALLGIYPDDALAQEKRTLFHLFSMEETMDSNKEVTDWYLDEGIHKKLQQWLLDCMSTHPRAHLFTTASFVTMDTI